MPDQKEHDEPENLVEDPHEVRGAARSLEDAVDSNATLEGYFAMNNIRDEETEEALKAEKQPEREGTNTAAEDE